MKKTISEIIADRKVYFKIISKSDIDRYSLKVPDYHFERFPDNNIIIGFRPVLALSKPDVIRELAGRFYRAGSDIVVIETGYANRYYLVKYNLSELSYELNYSYAKLVREEASKYSKITREKPRFVAGEITSVPSDLSKEEIKNIYTEQFKAFYAAKVGLILFNNFETLEQTFYIIDVLEELMIKRKKTTEFIICNKDEKYLKEISKRLSKKTYENVKLIGLCSEKNINNNEDKNYYRSVIIDIEENNSIENITDFIDSKEFKVVGFRENVTPDLLNKLI